MINIIQSVASSAVIAVIINMIFQSKSNRVQFLTSSRAEWRTNLKMYAEQLNKSDYRDIDDVLTKIKMNLNGYGCYNLNDYPSDEKLDFLKDEHIWKEINNIEVACRQKKNSKIVVERHKQRLIQFLGLLLKFDWERSKEEVKMNIMALISLGTFVIMIISCFFQMTQELKDIFSNENFSAMIVLLILPFWLLWLPYLLELPKLFKIKKWYKCISTYPLFWIIGLISQICVLEYYQKYYKIDITIPIIFYFVAFVLSINYPIMRRNMFIEYDNAIMRIMKIDTLIIYSMNSEVTTIRALSFFIKHGLNSRVEYNNEVILDSEKFSTYLEGLVDKKEILHFGSRISYGKRKEKNILEFVKEKPKRCRLIVEFKTQQPEGNIEFSVGFKKKQWRKWMC